MILRDPMITSNTKKNVESFVNNKGKRETGKNVKIDLDQDLIQDQGQDRDPIHVLVHAHVPPLALALDHHTIHAHKVLNVRSTST
jgi:hypothetical protein